MSRPFSAASRPEPPWAADPMSTQDAAQASASHIAERLERMVLDPVYPCLGARSVFARHRATVRMFDELGSRSSANDLLAQLREFATDTDVEDGFASFVAVFRHPPRLPEEEFERLLWHQLQLVHEADPRPWSPRVSKDPTSPHFSFSAGGTAYFVVGMHPDASRMARRAPLPTLVFNLHEQFERLRASGRFGRMQRLIRRRDTELQGGPNPMVADFGSASEARQYAGRLVPQDWSPPVHLGTRSEAAGTAAVTTVTLGGNQGPDGDR